MYFFCIFIGKNKLTYLLTYLPKIVQRQKYIKNVQMETQHTRGYGWTTLCCEYSAGCFSHVPSSPYLKMSYFISKDENSSEHELERKLYDVLAIALSQPRTKADK